MKSSIQWVIKVDMKNGVFHKCFTGFCHGGTTKPVVTEISIEITRLERLNKC